MRAQTHVRNPGATAIGRLIALGAALAAFIVAGAARAQLPIPATTQFDYVGFIQEATLDPTCATDAHCGGTIKVNGHVVVIPKETVVEFPANNLTWQELFAQAPLPYGLATVPPSSGLALADLPAPLTTYEAHVIGNRVLGGPAGADLQIAGLVYISQQSLNSGAGFINFIDYALGEMRVGGIINDPNCAQGGTALTNPLCSGARVRINDPAGRYGRVNSPDIRFTVDPDNPTIIAGTGYPMCLPRTDPSVLDDALCPQAQRPIVSPGPPVVFQASIQTNDPVALPGVPPDPNFQVPFEVGDYIFFAGTVVSDNTAAPTAGPWPLASAGGSATTYVSAHTIVNNIAVYTWPGTNPVYIMTDVTILGTGGLNVLGAGEAAVRTRFEGMSTDPGRNVHLYGIDLTAAGLTSDRDWGTVGVDPGPPTGAVKGRWRFRPPCTATTATPKACTPPPAGTFLPPTRDMRAVVEGAWVVGQTLTAANGLIWGQFRAPIFEYIFPENIPGTPIVANNFNDFPFLFVGGQTSSAGTLVGKLNPWPDFNTGCTAPTANAGGPYTVASGGTVGLTGSATGTGPFTYLWSVSSGSLSDPTIPNPIFSAVGAVSPVTATFAVTGACGTSTVSTTITVNAALAPTVNHVTPYSLFSGAAGTIALSGTDPNVPAQALTFAVTQSGTPALLNMVVTSTGASTATLTFTAPVLPLGQVTSSVVNLTITATNTGGTTSAAEFTTVTINPLPDVVTVTAAQYRTTKQRLDVTATSSVVSPNVTLTLQPYITTTGTLFTPPSGLFTNTGGGIYTITLVGVPQPSTTSPQIVVRSNLNGVSAPFANSVRQ